MLESIHEAWTHAAMWRVNEDEDHVCLQIELGNDRAVTLTVWKNGDPPRVSLWSYNGSQDFTQYGKSPDNFKRWIEEALDLKV